MPIEELFLEGFLQPGIIIIINIYRFKKGDSTLSKFFRIIFVFFLSLLFLWGCAAMEAEKKIIKKTEEPVIHKTIVIKPNRSYEECIELLPSHVMEYSFKASHPVSFNIHYHGEDRVHYPVSEKEVSEWNGILDVKKQGFYTEEQEYFCLMWENPDIEKVRLTFNCKLLKK